MCFRRRIPRTASASVQLLQQRQTGVGRLQVSGRWSTDALHHCVQLIMNSFSASKTAEFHCIFQSSLLRFCHDVPLPLCFFLEHLSRFRLLRMKRGSGFSPPGESKPRRQHATFPKFPHTEVSGDVAR